MKHFAMILAAFVAVSFAHMRMSNPPAINALENQYGLKEDQREPIVAGQFPCRGYHTLFPNDKKATPVADWPAGSQQKINIIGAPNDFQATHGGGSCQVSLSTDGGETFRVVKSYIGNCPSLLDDQNKNPANGQAHGSPIYNGFPFTVPKDLPTGPALFAWTWFNHIGNREMYMNCASIEITGETGDDDIKFDDRPVIFQANIANGCETTEGFDVDFPQPGPDVVVSSNASRAEPIGACGEIKRTATPVTLDPSEILTMGLAVVSGGSQLNDAKSDGAVNLPANMPADGNQRLEATKSASSSIAAATASQPDVPTASPSSATTGAASSGPGTSNVAGTTCPTDDGKWNCIGGTSFQRCASGKWTASQSMALGTACEPLGLSSDFKIVAKPDAAKREVRFSSSHGRHHADRYRR